MIEAERLRKTYRVSKRGTDAWSSVRSLFKREHEIITAVDDITFCVKRGESVGIIGPNGAGKSTLIKLLCGVLAPTSGKVRLFGVCPSSHRMRVVRRIGVVYGQRSQLWWDLPLEDSFRLLKRIYRVPLDRYNQNLRDLGDLLDMNSYMQTPVRQLSLGQRMRAEVAASLLHEPEILILDEPTIGLDIVSKDRFRQFVNELRQRSKMTLLVSSHDLSDMEEMAGTLFIIDRGKIIFNDDLEGLRSRFGSVCTLIMDLRESVEHVDLPNSVLKKREARRYYFEFDRRLTHPSELLSLVCERYPLRDVMIEEPSIESIVKDIYAGRS